ncbi:ATP-binding protein [Streptomyces abikoensis]|uniref:ATP-binding protein n=1 Tax=Streptomyces abikoensis TaxID=97398 RepID=UPI00167C1766|nr:tetratricopeptide repeat protein [Streptomyces abikoensis]
MHNEITGGVYFNVVAQGRHITLELPREITPALTGLPPAAGTFTGRDADLALLADALRPGPPAGDAPRVWAVAGLPGVGKTELVLQAARHALDQDGWFPGGVLFVDLFGYDDERRLTPERALGSLLRALGIPDEHVPADLQDRARLYGSVLSAYADQGRRVLVVVDNAGTAEQARPLLPADPRVPVLVTSRHTLAGLGARLLDLSELDDASAVDLLRQALREARGPGDTRVADDPAAAAELAGLCGNLPLALRIVAALLADLPGRPLASMADALADSRRRLERLAREDVTVRAVFGLSYAHLRPKQARLFRLLPLNPGPDLSTEAAVHLAGADPYAVEELLHTLARGHLIEPGAVYGRWRLHDLMRLYAAEQGEARSGEDAPTEALERLFQYYARTSGAAAGHLAHAAGPFLAGTEPGFATREEAVAWLDDERANLVAASVAAPGLGARKLSLILFETLSGYFSLRRHFDDWLLVGATAMRVALDLDWPLAQAEVTQNLSVPMRHLRRFDQAADMLEAARAVYRKIGDRGGEGGALTNLGLVLWETRRFDEAIPLLEEAIAIHRETGDRHSEGVALTNLGLVLQSLRRFAEAAEVYREDVAICAETGDRRGRAQALNHLGTVLREEDRLDEAAAALTEAGALFGALDDRYGEAQTLTNLGVVLARQGRPEESCDAQTRAVEAFRASQAPHDEATALNNLGLALVTWGRCEEAVAPLEQAATAYRDLADRHSEGMALINLGAALGSAGRAAASVDACAEAVACYRETADRHREGLALAGLAAALRGAGRSEEARAVAAEAVPLLREAGALEAGARVETVGDLHSFVRAHGTEATP